VAGNRPSLLKHRHLFLLGLLLASWPARADRGELYTLLEVTPGRSSLSRTFDGPSTAQLFTPGVQLSACYGLTHSLHVGAALGFSAGFNTAWRRVTLQLADGSHPTGDLFEDFFSATAAAVLSWRVDTGHPFAPLARVELGGTLLGYPHAEFFPDHTRLALALPQHTELVPSTRLVVALEYRFADRWVASLGLSARHHFGGRTPWQLSVPLSVGAIW
jgi:hypothetical protein